MANTPEYVCTTCAKATPRSKLVVKKVLFTTMGEGASTMRARTLQWLCPVCLTKDTEYNIEKGRKPEVSVAV